VQSANPSTFSSRERAREEGREKRVDGEERNPSS